MNIKKYDNEKIEFNTLYFANTKAIDFILKLKNQEGGKKLICFSYSVGEKQIKILKSHFEKLEIYVDLSMKRLRKDKKWINQLNFIKNHVKLYCVDDNIILSSANISSLGLLEFFLVFKGDAEKIKRKISEDKPKKIIKDCLDFSNPFN